MRHPRESDPALRDSGVKRPHRDLQQRRRRRLRARPAARDAADPQDGFLLRRREQASSSASTSRASSSSSSTRRARWPSASAPAAPASPASTRARAPARWWPRARRQREVDGETLSCSRRGLDRRPRHRQGLEGRHRGQPRLPQDRAQFQPDDGDRGPVTVAEVEELVEPGELDPDQIHTPGIFVQRIIQGVGYEKRIEQRTVRKRERPDGLDARRARQRARRASCATATT